MGAGKDWGIPLGLAVLTFSGLMLLPEPQERIEPGVDDDGVDFVFPERPRIPGADHPATVLVLSRDPQPVDGTWRTPHVAMYESAGHVAQCLRYSPCVATHEVADANEPRLGQAGFNGTRVTVHVFDAQAELVFSNGNATEQARLVRTTSPQQLPAGTWYLGANATLPSGTQRLPPAAAAFLDQVRPHIAGLPVGGVASMQTDALAVWYGTLFVTLRVDELVHAP